VAAEAYTSHHIVNVGNNESALILPNKSISVVVDAQANTHIHSFTAQLVAVTSALAFHRLESATLK
jgi:hypothetical protein